MVSTIIDSWSGLIGDACNVRAHVAGAADLKCTIVAIEFQDQET